MNVSTLPTNTIKTANWYIPSSNPKIARINAKIDPRDLIPTIWHA